MHKHSADKFVLGALFLCALALLIGVPTRTTAQQIATPTPTPVSPTPPATQQINSPCGVVDAIDYPIDGISLEHDDFGLYRASFGGRHTGIDMAFDRYGDPVHAAARGRVTYADPKGWDTEKGVVIIEHFFPDNTIFYSLYGHMEQINGHAFPKVGACVALGDVIGAVGHPSRGAPHLHYEIRRMDGTGGGPGYYSLDPLDGGWLHPIDFTERWQLALKPMFRAMLAANNGPIVPPVFESDGNILFAEDNHLERRSPAGDTLLHLDIANLTGIMPLADGRILARTADDQITVIAGDRFSASWKADRALASPPLRIGAAIAFLSADQRVVSYTPDGALVWQTDRLGDHLENYAVSGEQLALSMGDSGGFRLLIVDASGKIVYQGSSPAPIILAAAPDGFYVMTATQIGHLDHALIWHPMLDVGQSIGRNAQLAVDLQGGVVLYPGHGRQLFAFSAQGILRWQAALVATPLQAPLLAIGAGCLVYALTGDGALLAYRASDGQLRGLTSLYAGGVHGHAAARWLRVLPGGQVQFSAGYMSIATIDGPTLAGINGCG